MLEAFAIHGWAVGRSAKSLRPICSWLCVPFGRGKHETAHRTKQRCGQIFRYAVATGRATRDITIDLRGALAPIISKNHAAITEPTKIGALLRAIEGYDGYPSTGIALKLAPLLFVRPGELRAAEWAEIDLEAVEWRIPKRAHEDARAAHRASFQAGARPPPPRSRASPCD